jgi:hypothetical protein
LQTTRLQGRNGVKLGNTGYRLRCRPILLRCPGGFVRNITLIQRVSRGSHDGSSACSIRSCKRLSAPPSFPFPAPRQIAAFDYGLDLIWIPYHTNQVKWAVELADEFKPEFDALAQSVRREILALARVLQEFGPQLGRPRVDTLKGSRHANMKELRFSAADGEWRVAFAFDPRRRAILLVAGNKSGGSEKRFYRELIRKADERFDAHLARSERGT